MLYEVITLDPHDHAQPFLTQRFHPRKGDALAHEMVLGLIQAVVLLQEQVKIRLLRSLAFFRITSYNVCYTKLLRPQPHAAEASEPSGEAQLGFPGMAGDGEDPPEIAESTFYEER